MRHYIYDGTFEGLLTAIYEVFHRRELPGAISTRERYQPNLLCEELHIETNLEHAEKVSEGIREKISREALKNVFYAYLSEIEQIEIALCHYLKLGFKVGDRVDRYLADDWVKKIHLARQKTSFECHRMLGLLRFRQLQGNVYYATMEPDHNIVCLIAPHFASRLADQNWIIHDLKRNLAVIYDQKEWMLTPVTAPPEIHLSTEEVIYQSLWQEFFDTIAIEDRVNPRLQRHNMPARYWKHLVEKVGK